MHNTGKETKKGTPSPASLILNKVVFPACIIFTVIIFASYLLFMMLDFNVTETRDAVTQIFNGYTDETSYEYEVGREFSFDLIQLIGFVFFTFSLAFLGLLKNLDISAVMYRLLHFTGAIFSFFLFVLVLSGIFGEVGLGTSMGAILVFAIIYFLCLGIKTLLTRLVHIKENKFTAYIKKYAPPMFVIFTATVVLAMALAMLFKVNVMINKVGPEYPYDDRIAITTWETVITPLAPTFQNYLRYFGSAAAFMLAFSLLYSKFGIGIRILINFLINAASFSLLWLVQLDFFTELDNALLYAIVGFIAVYGVAAIASLIIRSKLKVTKEITESYDNQFMPGKS